MVLTGEGLVANPRPGIAAAALVRASLLALDSEGRLDPAVAAASLWRLHRCAIDEGLGISAGLSAGGGGSAGGMAGATMMAVCEALECWSDDYEVCWAGCELLAELLGCFEQGRVVALELGAAERVSRALLRHHGTPRRVRADMAGRGEGRPFPQVGLAGCMALRALLRHHRDGGRTACFVAEAHGAEAVVDTLSAAAVMEDQVAAVALSALVAMLPPDDGESLLRDAGGGGAAGAGGGGGSMAARRAVLRAGAVETAVGAMRGLLRAIAVQEEGVRFLGTLATMGSERAQEHACVAIARAGGVSAILAALLSHPRSNPVDGRCSTTHYFGIWVLHALACGGSGEHGEPSRQGGRVLLRQSVGRILTQVGVGSSERQGGVAELLAVREKHSANRTLVMWCDELLDVADELLGEKREAARLAAVAARGRRGRVTAGAAAPAVRGRDRGVAGAAAVGLARAGGGADRG